MDGAYDDRDGKIWMDGELVEWRDANVHVLTHALHYASSVFEGERCYNGKIFLSRKHSERLHYSASCLDFEIPYTVDQIEAAKALGLSGRHIMLYIVLPQALRAVIPAIVGQFISLFEDGRVGWRSLFGRFFFRFLPFPDSEAVNSGLLSLLGSIEVSIVLREFVQHLTSLAHLTETG